MHPFPPSPDDAIRIPMFVTSRHVLGLPRSQPGNLRCQGYGSPQNLPNLPPRTALQTRLHEVDVEEAFDSSFFRGLHAV